jgi:hypothetical protein
MSSTDDDLEKQFGQLFGDDVEPLRGKGANHIAIQGCFVVVQGCLL